MSRLRIEPIGYRSVYVEIDGLSLRIEAHHNSIGITPVNDDGEKTELRKTRIIQGGSWSDGTRLPTPKAETNMQRVSEIRLHRDETQ